MKLRHLIWTASAATLSYLAVKNRDKIRKETQETLAILKDMDTSYTHIQEQLAFIQAYQTPIKEMTADLHYKLRVYQQSIAGNLSEIQRIQTKYQTKPVTDSSKLP